MPGHRLSDAIIRDRLLDFSRRYDETGALPPPDAKRSDLVRLLLQWAVDERAQGKLFTDAEQRATCGRFVVLKAYLRPRLTQPEAAAVLERLVHMVSRMFVLGSRLMGGLALELYEQGGGLDDATFAATFADDAFVRLCFKGGQDQKARHLNPILAQSPTFVRLRTLFPSVDERSAMLTLTGWGNIVNVLQTTYKTNLKLHVLRHLPARILAHVRREALIALDGRLAKDTDGRVCIEHGADDAQLPLSDLYAALAADSLDGVPPACRPALQAVRAHFTDAERKRLPEVPTKGAFCARLFNLHLMLRAAVPTAEQNDAHAAADAQRSREPRRVQLGEDGAERVPRAAIPVERKPPRGWAPVPVARLSRTHVCIDQKVLTELQKVHNWPAVPLSQFFGGDREALQRQRRELRRQRRQAAAAARGTQRNRAARDARRRATQRTARLVAVGTGRARLLASHVLTSVVTDGVSASLRYCIVGAPSPSTDETVESKAAAQLEEARRFYKERQPRLIAIDPGRVNLATTVEAAPPPDGASTRKTFRTHALRRSAYHRATLRQRFAGLTSAEKPPELLAYEDALSANGGWKARHGAAYATTVHAFGGDAARLDATLAHYGRAEVARRRMLQWRRKQSFLMQRWSAVIGRSRAPIVVGYGAATVAPAGKGEMSVPTVGTARALKKTLDALGVEHRWLNVDEHRTTATHHACGCELDSVRVNGRAVRGLKLCGRCGRDANGPVFLNRDVNAAWNLLLALRAQLEGAPRPEHLQRQPRAAKRRSRAAAGVASDVDSRSRKRRMA